MSDIDFGEPTFVDELPPASVRGGRKSTAPALQAFIAKVPPGKIAELPSKDEDGGHPVARVTQMRKLVKDGQSVETRPIVPGKRYRIFIKVAATAAETAAAPNGKPAAKPR